MSTHCSNEPLLRLFGDDSMLWRPSTKDCIPTARAIGNKIVLLYFSAHWCAPCSHFTPVLIQLYHKLKQRYDIEVVYCSYDKTREQYQSYTNQMPWMCLPMSAQQANMRLAKEFHMEGIPHLVVVGADGKAITEDGVGEVTLDPEGHNFPWKPKTLQEVLPPFYFAPGHKGGMASTASLDNKHLMLYFSASWCPPCQIFTPQLSKAYLALKKHRQDFEVMFISADQSMEDFNEYRAEMPFAALPFGALDARRNLIRRYEIRGYPTLLMLGPMVNGERAVINANCRAEIEGGDYISDFPFYPKAYGSLEGAPDDINTHKCLIVFYEEGDDEEQEDLVEAIKVAATQSKGIKLYWAIRPTQVSSSIRQACQLGSIHPDPQMIMLDIPNGGAYYVSDEVEITTEAILKFCQNPGTRLELS